MFVLPQRWVIQIKSNLLVIALLLGQAPHLNSLGHFRVKSGFCFVSLYLLGFDCFHLKTVCRPTGRIFGGFRGNHSDPLQYL